MHWICLAKPEQLRLSFIILWWWDKGGILCILCGKRIYMFFCFVLSTFTCHTSLDTAKISAFLLFNFRTAPLDFESRTAFLTSSGKEKKIKKKMFRQKLAKLLSDVHIATTALLLAYLPCGLQTYLKVWVLWSFKGLLKCTHHFKMFFCSGRVE